MDFINIKLFGGRIDCYKHALKSVINNPNDPNPKDIYEYMLAEVEQKSGALADKLPKNTVKNKILTSKHLENLPKNTRQTLTQMILPSVRKNITTNMTSDEVDAIIRDTLITIMQLH